MKILVLLGVLVLVGCSWTQMSNYKFCKQTNELGYEIIKTDVCPAPKE
jgi:hypothetical protein